METFSCINFAVIVMYFLIFYSLYSDDLLEDQYIHILKHFIILTILLIIDAWFDYCLIVHLRLLIVLHKCILNIIKPVLAQGIEILRWCSEDSLNI